jgi:hypothetical protein
LLKVLRGAGIDASILKRAMSSRVAEKISGIQPIGRALVD